MIIPVKVKKRILTCKKPLVSENVETYSISISVDEEWEGFNTRVVFYNSSMEIGDNNPKNVVTQNIDEVTIPWEVLQESGYLYLTLIGTRDTEVIKTKEMDNPIIVNKAGMSEGDTPLEPTPDIIQLIINTAQQAKNIAQSVRDDANAGKFNGEKGPKGDPGTTDYTQLQNLPFIPVTDREVDLTRLSDGFYIIISDLCNVNVNGSLKGTFEKGTIFTLSNNSLYFADTSGANFVDDYTNDIYWSDSFGVSQRIFNEGISKKQNKLVSGENIKTINNESILGSGNFELPKSPITVVNESDDQYTVTRNGLYYTTKEVSFNVQIRNHFFGHSVNANSLVLVNYTDTTAVFLSLIPPTNNQLEDDSYVSDYSVVLEVNKIKADGSTTGEKFSFAGLSYEMDLIFNILQGAIFDQEAGRLVTTGSVDEEIGFTTLNTSGIGKGLKLENQELSVNTEDLDISQALVKFKNIDNVNLSITMKEFAEAMMQYFQTYDEQISNKQDEIVLGDGLKWKNGKLCLDIANGDNLKYGTSTQSTEANENEVVSNE